MAEEIMTPSGKVVEMTDHFPKRKGIKGRKRKPTDYDNLVLDAYNRGEVLKIEFGDDQDTLANVKRDVDKALDLHGLGADKEVEDGYYWVRARDKKVYQYGTQDEAESESEDDEDDEE